MKDKINNFKSLFIKILKFKVFYKLIIFIVISPLINKILQIYLNSNSKGIAFNQYILFNFLTIEGIVIVLMILMIALITVVYELSVITNMITLNHQSQDFRIYDVMKTSLLNLSCLKHPSSFLAGLYFLLILPLVHVGYISSLLPSLKIPNFIFGELSLTLVGNILIIIIYGLYFGIYLLMLFVPVLMIIKKQNIISAFKTNFKLHKLLSLKERCTFAMMISIWIILEAFLVKILPDALIKNSDFNRYFFKNIIISSRFRIYILEYIVFTAVILVLMLIFYQTTIKIISKYEPELIETRIDLEFNRSFDQKLLQARIHGNKFVKSLDKYIFATRFYQKYWGIINLVFWALVLTTLTYLFANAVYILSALLIVVILMYFCASIIARYEKKKNNDNLSDDNSLLFLPYRIINRTLNKSKIYNQHPKIVTIILATVAFWIVGMYLEPLAILHQPWVIGHRGSAYGVENTIGAVEAAAKQGGDYAEIDIQLSSDGIPVVVHDFDLSRLADKKQKVKEMTAQELANTIVYNSKYADKIPTLDHLIKTLKKNDKTIGLLIELKIEGNNGKEMAKKVIDVVEKNKYQDQAVFMSLDYDTVEYLQTQRPKWWIGYCIYGSAGDIDVSIWNLKIDFLAVEENQATVSFVEKANRNWIPVYVWTVDDPNKMEQYLQIGISGIITNYPDRAKQKVDYFKENNYEYYHHYGPGYPKS